MALAATGCRGGAFYWDGGLPQGEPVLEQRRQRHPSGELSAEWLALVHADGSELKHGVAREWDAGGTLRAEREYRHGEPVGTWRTWHVDGTPRSEQVYDDPARGIAGALTWWHASGALAARGGLVGGTKQGFWTYWHPNGQKSEEGHYVGGLREGEWTAWWSDGSLRSRGVLQAGRRAGVWHEWDESGVERLLGADEAPVDQ